MFDGCSRVVVTKGPKEWLEVGGGGLRAILEQTLLRGNHFYMLKFRTCASC